MACPGNALASFPESGVGCLFAAAPPRSGATVTGSGDAGGREAGRRLGMCCEIPLSLPSAQLRIPTARRELPLCCCRAPDM